MTKEADCRLCKHFVPASRMSDDLKEQALIWIAKNRPNKPLLGWCDRYRRPVTHYTGTCFGFLPKRRSEGCMKLDAFFKGD